MWPATLQLQLAPNIRYYGIDIAIQEPSPNLRECDILQEPISSEGTPFDLVVAQGLFEYLADSQSQKFSEIADILTPNGKFIVSYVNFDHRQPNYYWPYSNIQPSAQFRNSLAEHFVVEKQLPTAHHWNHTEPERWYAASTEHAFQLERAVSYAPAGRRISLHLPTTRLRKLGRSSPATDSKPSRRGL